MTTSVLKISRVLKQDFEKGEINKANGSRSENKVSHEYDQKKFF